MHNLLSRSVRNGLLTGLAFIASSVMLSACSVSVPSADEQAILAKDNNLPGGAPIWFTRATGGGAGYGGAATGNGIIPQVVTPPPAVAAKNESVEYPILVRSQEQAKQSESKPVAQAMSALDRINDQCPGSESEVNTTLTNTNRDEKIAKYESLTRKCPMSADLQLWLSQEYLKANKLVAARTGFEQVLVLDPTNEDAKAGIIKAERMLSGSSNTTDH